MKSKPKILITGSSGVIGTILVPPLKKKGYRVVPLDLKSPKPVDILKDNLQKYISGVETIIHLAADPDPRIDKKTAQKNLLMVKRIIAVARKNKNVQRIINASTINVYPYHEMYVKKQTITSATKLSPNMHYQPGEYAKAKIRAEHLVESFCKKHKLSCINLRFGLVRPSNRESVRNRPAHKIDLEHKIFLHHKDLRDIISNSLNLVGIHHFLCLSNKSWLADHTILFPLKKFQ